ncbi:MAG: hypothetical protein ACRDTJ_23480, partial [Pseudonocardiaceae bacterium]
HAVYMGGFQAHGLATARTCGRAGGRRPRRTAALSQSPRHRVATATAIVTTGRLGLGPCD